MMIYNSLTHKKEAFKPLEPGKVRYYTCGPTTYDFAHVGNARSFVVGDLLNRILRVMGYDVTYVRNFTDVDDKIIEKANELGVPALEHSARFIKECEQDMASLGMKEPEETPLVSTTMPEIIQIIEKLIAKGAAYEVDGEVLYHVPKFPDYGKLSKKDLESLQHGIRVDVNALKKHPSDFVLWKPAKEGEPAWDSPWGKGRPGWHIECSAMNWKHHGEQIDIHHGGVDLIFPHHENEIAQSEAAHDKKFCQVWCHNEFLNFGSEKMSKSLGNVITIRKFVETYGGELLRQVLMPVHYRSKMEWNDEILMRGLSDLERLQKFLVNFKAAKKKNFEEGTNDYSKEVLSVIDKMKEDFANDFNVPSAFAKLFTLIRDVNRDYFDEVGKYQNKKKLTSDLVEAIESVIKFSTEALGCFYPEPEKVLEKVNLARKSLSQSERNLTDDKIEDLLRARLDARKNKDWGKADEIRDQLKAAGVVIKDNPDGTSSWQYE